MLSDKLIRLKLSSFVDPQLYCFINNSASPRRHCIANASGTSSSMKNVSREVELSLPVPIPPLKEQRSIVKRLGSHLEITVGTKNYIALAVNRQSALAAALVEEVLKWIALDDI